MALGREVFNAIRNRIALQKYGMEYQFLDDRQKMEVMFRYHEEQASQE